MKKNFLIGLLLALVTSAVLIGVRAAAQTRTQPITGQVVSPAAAPFQIYIPRIAGRIPSSIDLIDVALQNGEINAETALEYKIFSSFGDSRLPAMYTGDPAQAPKEGVNMVTLRKQFAGLSPAAQAVLRPFLLPPSEPDSWINLPTSAYHQGAAQDIQATPPITITIYYTTPSSNIKIWWFRPTDVISSGKVAAVITPTIWSKFTSADYMNIRPLSDAGFPKNGGGPEYDIYLLHMGAGGDYGEMNVYTPTVTSSLCPSVPTYIEINLDKGKFLTESVAHEFFHSLQYAFERKKDCDNYSWWDEATATWAETQYDPTSKSALEYVDDYILLPGKPLDYEKNNHQYGAYLFPLYLSNILFRKDIIRTSFVKAATMDGLKAVDDSLPGGFEKTWPDFVKYLWNDGPVKNFAALKIPNKVYLTDDMSLGLVVGPDANYNMPVKLDRLTSVFYHYKINDPNVRSLAVTNPFYDAAVPGAYPNAEMQAIIKYKDNPNWEFKDFSTSAYATYCLDVHAERVEEVLFVFSNSAFAAGSPLLTAPKNPEIRETNIGCYAYSVKMNVTADQKGLIWTWTTQSVMTATVYAYPPLNADYSLDFYGTPSDTMTYQAHTHSAWYNSLVGINYSCQGDYQWSGNLYIGYLQILDPYNLNQKNLGSLDRQYKLTSSGYALPNGNSVPVNETCQPSTPLYEDRAAYQYRPFFDYFTHPIEGDVYELLDDNGLINYHNIFSAYYFYFTSTGDMTTYNTTYTFTPVREP